MNGIFPADLAVYLLFTPIVNYLFFAHRWTGFLPWYYLSVFCLARIVGGGLGVHDSNGLPANIIQSVGITPLILAIDGLAHEARCYRHPSHNRTLGWSVVIGTSGLMIAALALSISGSLNIFEGTPKSDSLTEWKAGTVLILVTWDAPGYHGGTALLQGALVALAFVGIRVIYGVIAVFTQKRDLSPVYGTTAVRVVLMFLPEVLATMTIIAVGLRTRHIRHVK
ncbi:integral membrane protein [Penicillium atrosanguineum]|nr:integral membrane protein [Penicillium atrosanguineum]